MSERAKITRRQLVLTAAALPGVSPALTGCSLRDASDSYGEAADRVRQPLQTAPGSVVPMRELVRYATLAPSSHNTQCWTFRIAGRTVTLQPDLSRRCPAVDPDDHHLFVSLGCATENLVQAALAHGLEAEVDLDPGRADAVRIALAPTRAVETPSSRAMADRQSTRGPFDGKPLSLSEMRQLVQVGTGPGVSIRLFTDKPMMERVLDIVVTGNSHQMQDAAFMAELKHWIRFSDGEAVQSGDGLATRTTGNPSVPRWLASPLFGLFVSADSERDKYAAHIRSSAGIAVFVSDVDDRSHWVEAGRSYERFALQATALGIRTALVNQPVEVQSLRSAFASLVGCAGMRPDMVVRFGRGSAMPRSLRRGVGAVLAA